MPITYPVDCTTAGHRSEYLYRLQEKLRLRHNNKGAQLAAGDITQAEYDDWLTNTWTPRSNRVSDAILRQRKKMKGQDGTYTPEWEPDVTDAD